MTILPSVHEGHEATFVERGGRRVVAEYGRPARTHRAVRNVVGVIEHAYDVVVVTGDDRVEYVDNAVSNQVPSEEERGVYALLLNPQGRIRTEMYVYNAGERLLVVLPPGKGPEIASEWQEKTFIQDVDIEDATEEFAVFGVHGAKATEKIASVCNVQTPDEQLTFVRGSMGDAGVTVVRTDGLTGEEGYEVICRAEDARDVFDTLENRGLNAAPFGYQTWESLTLEAGTPLFETELEDEVPNNLGLRNAVDFEKGCFVGQEVVSRVENRGQATKRLVGLTTDAVPEAGATVFAGDETAGEVTRACESPMLDTPAALALLDRDVAASIGEANLTVRIDGEESPAEGQHLPFVDGSDQSARLPSY
ncbi:aminomethyl transferase family protein [Halovenus sp. WSH3]|uniref:Aminomethyl transferase family protein n=1 Tax=Halovenus carboxidivorans TaxID=2692199 RepID=A0A6B0T7M9_9EURY|nr:aminomethyltransferase family protein [Halovenus carboxidivorans]MXR51603.1 aminomethyl transferase family protein [Halovenus carboxidivorans]